MTTRARRPADLPSLRARAVELRRTILRVIARAGSGHPGGSLSMVELLVGLYWHALRHDPKRPDWADRDRLILSNGHICPIRYVTMAHAGYFPKQELMTLRKLGSRLQGHPEREKLPGVETTSGPLGSGSSQAVGLAYAALLDQSPWRVYCAMSDGELEAGQTWEALLFAGRNKLYNCTFIIDRNNIQIDGTTEEIMPLEPLVQKFEAFNLNVVRCAGNSIRDFVSSVERAQGVSEKPTIIIADTIPGYGINYMEYDFSWHGKPPNPGKESETAIRELRTLAGRIVSEHE